MKKQETRGRPRIGKQVCIPLTVRLPEDVSDEFIDECNVLRMSKSEVLRRIIDRWLRARAQHRRIKRASNEKH